MANTNHPLDVAVEEFDTAHRTLVKAFLQPDFTGESKIDDVERAALSVVEMAHRMVREYRLRQVAGDSFVRNGNTRLTRERFQDAGCEVIDLDLERRKRGANVIALFPNDRHAG